MVLSIALSVVAAAPHAASAGARAPAVASAAVVPTATAPAVSAGPSITQTPQSGHVKGTLNIYEVLKGGARTMDPAVAYDTGSYEPILNVYETLVNYNGSSTDTFVPTLATCVPGTVQCVTDYGSNLTGFVGSQPIYWTFVIDPAAHFYDPTTKASWGVYPTDVMFSFARTLGYALLPYETKDPGWIQAQALLPAGNGSWDSGIHSPLNNSPGSILGSMLINDTTYCPAAAITNAHGCVTFVANGEGSDWPYFLELVADNLGGSIVPCGWFSAQGAGMPDWSSNAAHGDGPCAVTQLGASQSTSSAAWTSYMGNLTSNSATVTENMTSWDAFELQANHQPGVNPNVQFSLVGSGPYYAGIIPGSAYQLAVNPSYAQPVGCSGAGGLATYTGYCDPAPGGYVGSVHVYWEPDDSFGISQYRAGSADLAGLEAVHTSTLRQLAAEGALNYMSFPTISDFFMPINLYWSSAQYTNDFSAQPTQTIPSDFFTNLALREFYVHSYPYTTVENTVRTVDGIQFTFNAGGPIPDGMGNYYPSNVSFPAGDPDMNASHVGGAAWWWAQATNVSSPYYDPQLASCTTGHPCTWAIGGLTGDPSDDIAIADWISEIKTLTGGALQPFGGASFDLTFDQFLDILFAPSYQNPLVSAAGTGWAPDYPDPTDYMAPLAYPDSSYTAPDAFSQQLGYGLAAVTNNTTCGHNDTTYADLVYWAQQAENPTNLTWTSICQGVAYSVAVHAMYVAAGLPVGPNRVLNYTLIEQILNGLSMYVWNGQANEVVSAAPWISLASLNQNPMIGGGGDQVWFQVHYAFTSTVTFQETGLTAGTTWSATFGTQTLSSSTSSIAFTGVGNGTYGYSVAFAPGYKVTPTNGTLVVGADVTVPVTFSTLAGKTFPVYLNETGLVSNTSWPIVITNIGTFTTNQATLAFALPNGTYVYTPATIPGYTSSPAGNITVAGAVVAINVTYVSVVLPVYTVSFVEAGLAAGQTWSVTLSNSTTGAFTLSSSSSTITFAEVIGSFTAVYTAPTGYVAPTSPMEVVVTGNISTVVPFSKTYTVTFTESGVSGQEWTVFFAGVNHTAKTATIEFNTTNGNWTYAIVAPSGYAATPAGGVVEVKGAATGVTATFSSTAQPGPSSSYLSKLAYELIAVLAVLVVIGFGLAAYMGFRRPPTSPPPKDWSEEATPAGTTTPPSTPDSEFESGPGSKT